MPCAVMVSRPISIRWLVVGGCCCCWTYYNTIGGAPKYSIVALEKRQVCVCWCEMAYDPKRRFDVGRSTDHHRMIPSIEGRGRWNLSLPLCRFVDMDVWVWHIHVPLSSCVVDGTNYVIHYRTQSNGIMEWIGVYIIASSSKKTKMKTGRKWVYDKFGRNVGCSQRTECIDINKYFHSDGWIDS